METQKSADTSNHVMLTGAILLANLDYTGLLDYALKALIGGVVWMGCKIVGDHLNEKRKRRLK